MTDDKPKEREPEKDKDDDAPPPPRENFKDGGTARESKD
jgi:hypothetical protein